MREITVLLPTYNSSLFIGDAIRSILLQTYKNFEFLIIDDGSTDNTKEIVFSFNDSRINFIERNHGGLSKTLNYGLKHASNSIIARMDADDIALPERIEKQMDFLSNNLHYDVISCNYGIFYKRKVQYLVELPQYDNEIKRQFRLHNVICHPGVIYNREYILDHGGYHDTKVEDYELWLRIKNDTNFYNLIQPLMLLRASPTSLSRNNILETNWHVMRLQKRYFRMDWVTSDNSILGWREFFYGNKNNVRNYWKLKDFILEGNVFQVFCYILTFLPYGMFSLLKKHRIKFRLKDMSNERRKYKVQLNKALKKTC